MNETVGFKYKIIPHHAIEGYEVEDIRNKKPFIIEIAINDATKAAIIAGEILPIGRMYVVEMFAPFKRYTLDQYGTDYNKERVIKKQYSTPKVKKTAKQYQGEDFINQELQKHFEAGKYQRKAEGNDYLADALYAQAQEDLDRKAKDAQRKRLERLRKKQQKLHRQTLRNIAKRRKVKMNRVRRMLLRDARSTAKAQQALNRYIMHLAEIDRSQRLLEIKNDINSGMYDDKQYRIRATMVGKRLKLNIKQIKSKIAQKYGYK